MFATSAIMDDDDFAIDSYEEEEPFDEPKSERRVTRVTMPTTPANAKNDRVGDEADMLSWTGSDLDDDGNAQNGTTSYYEGRQDAGYDRRTKSHQSNNHSSIEQRDDVDNDEVMSIHWSGSDLDADANVEQRDDNKIDDSRDEINEFRDTYQEPSERYDKYATDTAHAIMSIRKDILEQIEEEIEIDKSNSKERQQQKELDDVQNSGNGGPAIRRTRSIDNAFRQTTRMIDNAVNYYTKSPKIGDNGSIAAGSVAAGSVAAGSIAAGSVAASVTARTNNTKLGRPKLILPLADDCDDSAMGEHSVMTADLQSGPNMCSVMSLCQNKTKKKVDRPPPLVTTTALSRDEEEDLLDRFFENLQNRTCKNGKLNRKLTDEEEEGLLRVFNPFLSRLETFDPVFEQMEELVCQKEHHSNHEKQDTCGNLNDKLVKTPVAFAAAKFSELLDRVEHFDRCFATMEGTENTQDDSNDMEQKETSFKKRNKLEQMKQKWFAARLNFKLRQTMLAEVVKQNTAKAANATTKYMDSVVAKCTEPSAKKGDVSSDEQKNDTVETSKILNANKGQNKDCDGDESIGDEASIDNSDFFSVETPSISIMTPSEHSNINSARDFRSFVMSPSTRTNLTEVSKDESYSDHVLRSPVCLSPESRLAEDLSDFGGPSDEEENKIGVSTPGRLAVITEEVDASESSESILLKKKKSQTKSERSSSRSRGGSKSPSNLKRWTYIPPDVSTFNSSEWLKKCQETVESVKETVESVYTVSERFILDKASCSSSSINLSDSESFEDDQNQNGRKSARRRIKQQNSIVEEIENGTTTGRKSEEWRNPQGSYEDDLSDFQTAVGTFSSEPTDERPPMLRLQRSRHESRSCGSHSKEAPKYNGAPSQMSSELPKGYTLADSIRHAAQTAQTGGNGRKEPRGNKVKRDPSVHIRVSQPSVHSRVSHTVPQVEPEKPKEDPEPNPELQQKIRSPRSSETEDTARLTAQTTSSFEEIDTTFEDIDTTFGGIEGEEKKSVIICVESPSAISQKAEDSVESPSAISHKRTVSKEFQDEDDKRTVFSTSTDSFKDCMSRSTTMTEREVLNDNKTVFSINTTGTTGSDSFKDCYQDAIPSLTTMDTMVEKAETSSPAISDKNLLKENSNASTKVIPYSSAEASAQANLVTTSVAVLSVSAVILSATPSNRNRGDSSKHNKTTPRVDNSTNAPRMKDTGTPDNLELELKGDPDKQVLEAVEDSDAQSRANEADKSSSKCTDINLSQDDKGNEGESQQLSVVEDAAANEEEVIQIAEQEEGKEETLGHVDKIELGPPTNQGVEEPSLKEDDNRVEEIDETKTKKQTIEDDNFVQDSPLEEEIQGDLDVMQDSTLEEDNIDETREEKAMEETPSHIDQDSPLEEEIQGDLDVMQDSPLEEDNIDETREEKAMEETPSHIDVDDETMEEGPLEQASIEETQEKQGEEEVMLKIQSSEESMKEESVEEDVVESGHVGKDMPEETETRSEPGILEVIEEEDDIANTETLSSGTEVENEPEESLSSFLKTMEEEECFVDDDQSFLEPKDDQYEDEEVSKRKLGPNGEAEESLSTYLKAIEEGEEEADETSVEARDDDDEVNESISTFFRGMTEELGTSESKSLLEPKCIHDEALSAFLMDDTETRTSDDLRDDSMNDESISKILEDLSMEEKQPPILEQMRAKKSFQLENSYYFNQTGTIEKPKHRYKKALKKSRGETHDHNQHSGNATSAPLTVEDRRQRRLRQRRKFEKVLRGEDDSSAASSSYASSGYNTASTKQQSSSSVSEAEDFDNHEAKDFDTPNAPLFSSSFDTASVVREW